MVGEEGTRGVIADPIVLVCMVREPFFYQLSGTSAWEDESKAPCTWF